MPTLNRAQLLAQMSSYISNIMEQLDRPMHEYLHDRPAQDQAVRYGGGVVITGTGALGCYYAYKLLQSKGIIAYMQWSARLLARISFASGGMVMRLALGLPSPIKIFIAMLVVGIGVACASRVVLHGLGLEGVTAEELLVVRNANIANLECRLSDLNQLIASKDAEIARLQAIIDNQPNQSSSTQNQRIIALEAEKAVLQQRVANLQADLEAFRRDSEPTHQVGDVVVESDSEESGAEDAPVPALLPTDEAVDREANASAATDFFAETSASVTTTTVDAGGGQRVVRFTNVPSSDD